MKLPTEDGIYRGISWEDYRRIPRLNLSKLKHIDRSPFHFRAAELEEDEDSDAKLVGRAAHVAVLEPQHWLARFAIWDGPRRAGADWEKFKKDNAGLEILTAKQRDQVIAIQKAVHGDRDASKYLVDGSAEVTLLWTHVQEPIGGLPGFSFKCKGRVDFASGGLADLKTTRDASLAKFRNQSWDLKHHVGAGWYVDGYAAAAKGELRPFRIIAVDSKKPHGVAVYGVPERILDVGRATYRGWLARLHDCRERNWWPAYGELELELPAWAQKGDDEDTSGMDLEFEEEQSDVAEGL
jgi:hypothetical protein